MYEYENVSVEWADNTVRFDYVDRADERVPLDIPEHWHEELYDYRGQSGICY